MLLISENYWISGLSNDILSFHYPASRGPSIFLDYSGPLLFLTFLGRPKGLCSQGSLKQSVSTKTLFGSIVIERREQLCYIVVF